MIHIFSLLCDFSKSFKLVFNLLTRFLTYPLWALDSVEKERLILCLPYPIRKYLLRILFIPTLLWTLLLNWLLPQKRRWYDRIDHHVLI
eukprot:Pgem_evm1s10837